MFLHPREGRGRLEAELTLSIVGVLGDSPAECCGSSRALVIALRERIVVTFVSGTCGRR
jgi:hypothetical protein